MAKRFDDIKFSDDYQVNVSQCNYCIHFNKEDLSKVSCEAYKKQIPAKILLNEHDHRKPYKGDNGIRFELIQGMKKQYNKLAKSLGWKAAYPLAEGLKETFQYFTNQK